MSELLGSPIGLLCDQYLAAWADLDPTGASMRGLVGYDDRTTDYGPDAHEQRIALDRSTLMAVGAIEPAGHDEKIAGALIVDRLEAQLALADQREHLRPLRILGSPIAMIRQVFDGQVRATAEDWDRIATRLEAVPAAMASVRDSLQAGLDRGVVAARRQAIEVAEQCATWAGQREAPAFFTVLVEGASNGLVRPGEGATAEAHGLAAAPIATARLKAAADRATAVYSETGTWLRDTYAPLATAQDAVGRDRYLAFGRAMNGAQLDLDATYAWGWDELHRIEAEMETVAKGIVAGGTVAEAIELLETDPARSIEGEEDLRHWLQDLMDHTIAQLDGTHFDIAAPLHRVEAMIAPPGSAAAMYYTGPSEDFVRPGRTWYPTLGKIRFPLWGEVSICYHEGVPGHHLQIGQVRYLKDRLTRYQRFTGVSAHLEGWALYAERLMGELGYLDNPDYQLGQLRAQAMRAVRVIVDIGMHLELPIPRDDRFHPGATWNPDLGQEFVTARSCFPADFMASEIVRYLGFPAQAIGYKVGERAWLDGRARAQRRAAQERRVFDLKAWHRDALDLGPLGLDALVDQLEGCGAPTRP